MKIMNSIHKVSFTHLIFLGLLFQVAIFGQSYYQKGSYSTDGKKNM